MYHVHFFMFICLTLIFNLFQQNRIVLTFLRGEMVVNVLFNSLYVTVNTNSYQ